MTLQTTQTVDARGLSCPMPIVKAAQAIKTTASGDLEAATALGVEFIPCQMTMDIFGLKREDLIDEMGEPAGAATAIQIMTEADASLFI